LSGTSIVQRGKKFAIVCYAGVDPTTRKQRYKWFSGFATRKEAEQFRLTLAHHPTFGAGQGPYCNPRLRTGDYLKSWLNERDTLRTLRQRTVNHSRGAINHHLVPHIGHIPLARLSPAAIQNLYLTLLDHGLSPATVRRTTGILHVALQDAVKRGFILRNPQDNTTPPRVLRYEPTVPEAEEVAQYLADARETATPALYALYVTAATCGLRIGELTGLPENAADLGRGYCASVRRSYALAKIRYTDDQRPRADVARCSWPTWPSRLSATRSGGRRNSAYASARSTATAAYSSSVSMDARSTLATSGTATTCLGSCG